MLHTNVYTLSSPSKHGCFQCFEKFKALRSWAFVVSAGINLT